MVVINTHTILHNAILNGVKNLSHRLVVRFFTAFRISLCIAFRMGVSVGILHFVQNERMHSVQNSREHSAQNGGERRYSSLRSE